MRSDFSKKSGETIFPLFSEIDYHMKKKEDVLDDKFLLNAKSSKIKEFNSGISFNR